MLIRHAIAALPFLISVFTFAGEVEDIQQLLKSRQLPQALERADKFIASNPKDAQVRFLKGIIQTEMGKPEDAIKTFTALSADYPQLPEPYNNLAVLYAQQNQLDKARAALMRAIQTNPSYAIAHENLGDLYARLASQSYDKALQLENSNPNVQTKLTLVRDLFNKVPTATVASARQPATKPVVMSQAPVQTIPVKPVPPAPVVASPVKPQPVAASIPPVKPQPVIASAPPLTKPASASGDDRVTEKQKIDTAVHAWAESWSRQNVNAYLAAYEPDYHASSNQKTVEWAKERRERITAPKSIDVKLSNLKIDIQDENSAKVRLRQSYRSDRLSSTTSKTLLLKKNNGRWLIHEERTGG